MGVVKMSLTMTKAEPFAGERDPSPSYKRSGTVPSIRPASTAAVPVNFAPTT